MKKLYLILAFIILFSGCALNKPQSVPPINTEVLNLNLNKVKPQAPTTEKSPERCAGIGGIQCPNGYYCYIAPEYSQIADAMGDCYKIDLETATKCLKNVDVTVICSTKYKCARQKELLGDLFQYLKIKYDDEFTDCSKRGLMTYDPDISKCDWYHDKEYLGWIIASKPQVNPVGTRQMDDFLGMVDCYPQ